MQAWRAPASSARDRLTSRSPKPFVQLNTLNLSVRTKKTSKSSEERYWITDFLKVDPHLGTNQNLKDLISTTRVIGYYDKSQGAIPGEYV
ncbi:MAG: alpha-amylase family glycosyl hydrolase [Spirochaetota bacterium]